MVTSAILLTALFTSVACALLGAFLVLRKMTMVGDAISHAVLPGIAIAYWVSHTRATPIMFLGAAITGIAATLLIEFLHKKLRVQNDASIGMTFTFLFAIGVVLITYFSDSVDLDQECVLYGEIAFVPFNTWTFQGIAMGPVALWTSGGLLLLVVSYSLLAYKGIKLTTFNEDYAAVMGISVAAWNLSLMAMTSIATVVSFESVGAILVVALLVAPAATAYLLTGALFRMLVLSALFGALGSLAGYAMSAYFQTSIAGSIATFLGIQFFVVYLVQQWARKNKRDVKASMERKTL